MIAWLSSKNFKLHCDNFIPLPFITVLKQSVKHATTCHRVIASTTLFRTLPSFVPLFLLFTITVYYRQQKIWYHAHLLFVPVGIFLDRKNTSTVIVVKIQILLIKNFRYCLFSGLWVWAASAANVCVRLRSHRHEYESGTIRVSIVYYSGRSHTYEYGLPINFTRTSSFCAGRVIVQPMRSNNP